MLDGAVVKRMTSILEGNSCCKCGDRAERFRCSTKGLQYFCQGCYLGLKDPEWATRTYRSPIGLGDDSDDEEEIPKSFGGRRAFTAKEDSNACCTKR